MTMIRKLLIGFLRLCEPLSPATATEAVPAFFIANQGQAPENLRFLSQGLGRERHYFYDGTKPNSARSRPRCASQFPGSAPTPWKVCQHCREKPTFSGATTRSRTWTFHFTAQSFTANCIPASIWLYRAEGRNLKSEYIVAPGADPRRIRIAYEGVSGLQLEEDGSLELR